MNLWRKILNTLSFGKRGGGCHGEGMHIEGDELRKISIVGSRNVVKSLVCNRLTGA